jgi:transcription elongation factor SPT5
VFTKYIAAVPSDLWLIDPAFRGKKVVVEISGRAEGKWSQGEYDGLTGYILSVFDPRTDTTTRTAQFMPLNANHNKDKVMTVPIEYLIPVNPTAVNDHAIILNDSKKGHEVVLREESGGGHWTVGPYQVGSVVYDCAADRMVKVQKDFG